MRVYDKEVAKSFISKELEKTKKTLGIVCFDYFTCFVDHKRKNILPILVKSNKLQDFTNICFLFRELGWSVGKEVNGAFILGIETVEPDIKQGRLLQLSYAVFATMKESKNLEPTGEVVLFKE